MATHTTFDVLQESRGDDYLEIDRGRDLSEAWKDLESLTKSE